MNKSKGSRLYQLIFWAVKTCYPEIEVIGQEKLPTEPVIFVGNHCQMNGPIAGELYIPGAHYIWCAGEMMDKKEVPAYAYRDFWSNKPKYIRWFYKLLSYCIAPLSVCIFNNAHTIGVYHDMRIISTFKETVRRLEEGNHIVIFPEHSVPHNNIVCQFQDRFIDVAKLYYKHTGKTVSFVPVYLAPKLKKMYLGDAMVFDPKAPIAEERQRIVNGLMDQITDIAVHLPEHIVVPYNNIPSRKYGTNVAKKIDG